MPEEEALVRARKQVQAQLKRERDSKQARQSKRLGAKDEDESYVLVGVISLEEPDQT